MFKLRVYLSFIGLLILFGSCASDDSMRTTEDPPTVEEVFGNKPEAVADKITSPLEGLEVSSKPYNWQAHEGGTINLPNGTKLIVPAHAVIDAEGGAVTGPVSLNYREFQDIGEIFLSGLSMHFDSAGLRNFMRSTGMLEIRASKNGEPLFLAEGKSIEIVMPSPSQGPFNLYHYNEEDNRWKFVLSREAQPKEVAASSQRRGKLPLPPVKPGKISPTDIPFNYAVRTDHLPELASYFGLQWVYAGISRGGSLDASKEVWVNKKTWPAVTLESYDRNRGLYMLHLRDDEQKVKVIVKPVMEIRDYEMALVDYMEAEKIYKELKAAYDRENAAFASRSQMLRKCAINQFGYYNWDLPISPTQFAVLAADFRPSVKGTQSIDSDFSMVYLVLPEEKIVVAYPQDQWKNFRYMPSARNQILAIGKSEHFYMLDSETFDQAKGKEAFTFKLHQVDKKIATVQDLRQLLDGGV